MEILSPLLHSAAYIILTIILIRVAYRAALVKKLDRLPVHSTLQESKDDIVAMLDLAVIKVTAFEALLFVIAHAMLATGSIIEIIARPLP